MKKSRYSNSQILNILKQAENGVPVAQLCREHGMSSATFYKWRSKSGGMDASLMARMKELEKENRLLKGNRSWFTHYEQRTRSGST
jgi:putative transposase